MAAPEDDRLEGFASREPSFSIIYFSGVVREFVPSLLINCGYTVVSQTPYRLGFAEVEQLVTALSGQRSEIVYKAVYSVGRGTALLDPEMLVGVANDSAISDFCTKHAVDAFVAIWERVSETVIARHLAANGLRAELTFAQGRPQKPSLNPPPDLVANPGPASLKAFLAAAGAPTDEVFGLISASVLKLDETGMIPSSRN